MPTICRNLETWRHRARLASFATVTIVVCAMYSPARAQPAMQPPYALFEQSALTGSADTITVTWLPVATSAGTILYKNVTLQLHVDAAGNVTVAALQVVPAPQPVSSFRAGNYEGPSSVGAGKALVTVSGPGITAGGATEWSLAASPGAWSYTYPASATWYDGPLATSPLAPRLQAANITLPNWSYGIVGSQPWTIDGGKWFTNSLIGLRQSGNTLTIVTFTDNNSVDHNSPQDTIVYNLIP